MIQSNDDGCADDNDESYYLALKDKSWSFEFSRYAQNFQSVVVFFSWFIVKSLLTNGFNVISGWTKIFQSYISIIR